MKTDFSKLPREEVEARITTMLMGELPEGEAAELREYIAADAGLSRLQEELRKTISLVEEATGGATEEKLSTDRREKLLRQFKLIQPAEMAPSPRRKDDRRSLLAVAAMLVALLGFASRLMPLWSRSEPGARVAFLDKRFSPAGQLGESEEAAVAEQSLSERRSNAPAPVAQTPTEAKAVSGAASYPYTFRYFSDDLSKNRGDAGGLPPAKIELPSLVEATSKPAQERGIAMGGAVDTLSRVAGGNLQEGQVGRGFGGLGGSDTASKDLSLAFGVDTSAQKLQSKLGIQPPAAPAVAIPLPASVGILEDDLSAKNVEAKAPALQTALGRTLNETRNVPAPSGPLTGFALGETELTLQPAEGEAIRRSVQITATRQQASQQRKDLLNDAQNLTFGREELPSAQPVSGTVAKAKQELESLRSARASVEQRINQEKADVTMPRGGAVTLLDRAGAEADRKSSIGERIQSALGGGVERVVKVAPERMDISSLASAGQSASYDPYFIQTEQEKVKSQAVLGRAVDQLKLDQAWSEAEGRKLSRNEAINRLKKNISIEQNRNTGLMEIHAKAPDATKAAEIANGVADAYLQQNLELHGEASKRGIASLANQLQEQDKEIAQKEAELKKLQEPEKTEGAVRKPASAAAIPQPEVATAENSFSTFSLNVSDVSYKLTQASLEKGLMPDPGTVRSEEFINAFDYHDPVPAAAPVGFVWERARYPFAQDRDLIRLSVKTAASGREAGRPLNLVLLLDSSGSMERADRVQILRECLRTLAGQLRPEDRVSVVAFARTARLWVDGLSGTQANELVQRVGNLTPEGGTNLEEAMRVAYETARKHFLAGGVNRVVLLTDGAANLGDVQPESLKRKVETERRQGVALDCFGIGWEGLNDELLETLSRNGDGRYGFVNTPEAAATEFAGQLAGALNVAASDVKVQVEFNPKRVSAYRQIGYAKHQLTKEQFRDNTIDAAELGAAEAGNALYVVQVNPAGEGPLGTVRVRFKVPGTNDYREHEWPLTYEGASKALENSTYTMRLAGTASAFSEWLTSSPFASEVTNDRLLNLMAGVPENFANDPRPKQLVSMIRQAKSLSGK